jgi:NADPH:quinone reductase-like Zn-dependent oxidoreductase
VASFAIQLAKHLGARVITTASAANLDYLRELGADQVIDYNATELPEGREHMSTRCSRPWAATSPYSLSRC